MGRGVEVAFLPFGTPADTVVVQQESPQTVTSSVLLLTQ